METDDVTWVQRDLDDARFWEQLSEYLPWDLHGFTFRDRASFLTDKHQTIELTRSMFEDLLTAFRKNSQ